MSHRITKPSVNKAVRGGLKTATMFLLVHVIGAAANAQDGAQDGPADQPKPVAVVSAEIPSAKPNDQFIELGGRRISVKVQNLAALQKEAQTKGPLVLYLDGIAIAGAEGLVIDQGDGLLQFYIDSATATRDAWTQLLKQTRGFVATVALSVGTLKGKPVASATVITIRRIRKLDFFLSLLLLTGFATAFVLLARRSNMLRDLGADPAGSDRSYSLARTQMAIWTFAVAGAFLFIWMTTGSLDSVTGTAVMLMGISAATVLSSAALDTTELQKEKEEVKDKKAVVADLQSQLATATDEDVKSQLRATLAVNQFELNNLMRQSDIAAAPKTDGFLMDILSDARGVSLHRFQMLMWTAILSVIFVIESVRHLAMPQFNDMILALTGISAGTYVGFKIPENKKHGD